MKRGRIYGEIIQWICQLKYRNCLADKATCWGLMVAPDLWFCNLFSLSLTNWILGMGRSPGLLSLDHFGAIHYVLGWGKVSMWPTWPVFSPHSCWESQTLSHTARTPTCSSLRINVPRGYLVAPLEKPDHIRHRVTSRAEVGLSSSPWLSFLSQSVTSWSSWFWSHRTQSQPCKPHGHPLSLCLQTAASRLVCG